MALGLAYNRCTGGIPLFSAGPFALQSFERAPLPGPSWVRVRVRLAGICGSDLNQLRLRFSFRSASMARKRSPSQSFCMGHEAMGEVIELGAGVRTFRRSQRVVLVPGACCAGMDRPQLCPMCRHGLPLLCLNRDEFIPRLAEGGGWSEELVRHESQLIPVPEAVTDEQAVLVEPLACSVHAIMRRPPSPGDSVIVIGCGMIGLGMILALRALATPVRIIAIARHPHQAAQARAMGADVVLSEQSTDLYDRLASELSTEVRERGLNNRLLHNGAAVVYDAVGSGATLHHALRWTRPRGAVVVEGITPRPAPFDCSTIWLREIDLVGSHGHGLEQYESRRIHTFSLVLGWIKAGKLNPDALVSHRFPLQEYKSAIRAADGKARSKATKVLLQMPGHA